MGTTGVGRIRKEQRRMWPSHIHYTYQFPTSRTVPSVPIQTGTNSTERRLRQGGLLGRCWCAFGTEDCPCGCFAIRRRRRRTVERSEGLARSKVMARMRGEDRSDAWTDGVWFERCGVLA